MTDAPYKKKGEAYEHILAGKTGQKEVHMSKTDKTRPGWVQEKDPLNQRFRRVGCIRKTYDPIKREFELTEWFWKPMFPKTGCFCCCQKRANFHEDARERVKWRRERQDAMKEWKYDLCQWLDRDFYDYWLDDIEYYDYWMEGLDHEDDEGLRFIDFNGKYTVG